MGSKGPADGPTFFCFRLDLALRHNYDIAPSQRHHSHARKIPKVSKRPPKQPELVLGPLPIDTINKTIGTELEPGDVVLSRATQIHAARKHPLEYPHCLPHLAKVICDPLYIGDDHKNRGIELIGRIQRSHLLRRAQGENRKPPKARLCQSGRKSKGTPVRESLQRKQHSRGANPDLFTGCPVTLPSERSITRRVRKPFSPRKPSPSEPKDSQTGQKCNENYANLHTTTMRTFSKHTTVT